MMDPSLLGSELQSDPLTYNSLGNSQHTSTGCTRKPVKQCKKNLIVLASISSTVVAVVGCLSIRSEAVSVLVIKYTPKRKCDGVLKNHSIAQYCFPTSASWQRSQAGCVAINVFVAAYLMADSPRRVHMASPRLNVCLQLLSNILQHPPHTPPKKNHFLSLFPQRSDVNHICVIKYNRRPLLTRLGWLNSWAFCFNLDRFRQRLH